MHRDPQPVKLFTIAPMYRYGAPGRGRYREHWQASVEALGSDDPSIDAELIQLYDALLGRLGVTRYHLELNSIGCRECRPAYLDALGAWLAANGGRLDDDTRAKIDVSPLRVFDNYLAKPQAVRDALDEAPKIGESLCAACVEHFATVRADLDAVGVTTRSSPRSYAASTTTRGRRSSSSARWRTRTRPSPAAAATTTSSRRSAVRRRRASASARASSGCSSRWRRTASPTSRQPTVDVFLALDEGAPRSTVARWLAELRRAGVAAETDYAGRSLKGQLTQARRLALLRPLSSGPRRRRFAGRAARTRRSPTTRSSLGSRRELARPDVRRAAAEHAGRTITLAGWVARRRDHGGLVFVDLRDRTGITQLVINPERAPAAAELASEIRNEFVLQARGEVVARSADTVNPRMATGDVELAVDALEIVSRSTPLPFQLDEENVDETLRLRYRWLDLRREKLQRNLGLRARMVGIIRRHMEEAGFLDIQTPILYKSTPEGARDFVVPSRLHKGRFFALPQSPQILKQLTMIAGFDRYYQIAICFRDEDLRADRVQELTQLDVEMSFPDHEALFDLMEGCSRRSGATASASRSRRRGRG